MPPGTLAPLTKLLPLRVKVIGLFEPVTGLGLMVLNTVGAGVGTGVGDVIKLASLP